MKSIQPNSWILPTRHFFLLVLGIFTFNSSFASTVDSISCNGANDGKITTTLIIVDLVPWTYSWSNGASGMTVTGLGPGTYTVTVTGLTGVSASESFTLSAPSALNASSTKTDVACNGQNTGSVDLTVSGGRTPYSYAWSNGAATQDLSNLFAGAYTVTVTDKSGCTIISSATITEPSAINISHIKSDISCNNADDGSIDLSVSGATPAYSYLWSNGAVTQDLSALAGGTYTVTVTDNNGCTASQSVVIINPAVLSGTAADTDVTCFGFNNGSIDLSVSGGTAPFSYNWSNGATTQDLSSLAPGSYNVTITDARGCIATTGAVITQPSAALAQSTTKTDVLCNGAATGAIDLTVSGGTTPYTYAWSNGATSQDLTNIPAGTYNVTVTDAKGCTIAGGAAITQPSVLTASAVRTNTTCFGASDGTIDLTVSGGVVPYIYNWSNGATTQDLSGLAPGVYTVTVTDNNGCAATRSSTVTQPSALATSHSQVNVSCNGGSNGSINLSVAGGSPPYSFIWSNSATTEDISGLFAGNYTVTVSDVNSCTATRSITVTQPSALSLSTTKVDVSCNGGSNGSIDLTVSGGTFPYFYSWSTGANSQDLTNRIAGTYSVTVTDLSGCTATTSVTIEQPAVLTASNTRTNVTCNGANNGTISLTVSGGTTPYAFAWSNGATIEDLTGLAPGSYTVTVTDFNGCTRTSSAVITQPTAIGTSHTQINVACNGASTGSINLSVAGGTTPYAYIWSNGATTQDISSLPAGDYTVTVTDANNCTVSRTVTITQPAALSLSTTKVDVLCNGNSTGSIDLTVNGGDNPYSYAWSNGATSKNLNNIPAGNYTVTVTDQSGCTASTSATITQPSVIAPTTTQVNVLCFGGNNGSIDLTVAGGTPPYTYDWSNGPNTQDISTLTSGTYSVTIEDAAGCTVLRNTTITQPALLNPTSTQTNVSCFGLSDGAVNLSVSGGVTPYLYNWSNGATTQDISGLLSGSYTVTVTDANNCTATRNVTITQPAAPLSSSLTQVNVTCNGGSNGSIDLTVTGGTTSYGYLWSTGATTQDLSSRPVGTYNVTVTDARGCTTTNSATLTQPTAINPTTAQVNVSCNGGNNGSIDLTVTGGVSPYSYLWSNGATSQDISGRTAGNYTVTVTDAAGCTMTKLTTITQPTAISPSSTQTNVSCFGGNNGSIDLSVSGGTPAYIYVWSNGATTQDISGLVAGSYTVTITDANSCTVSYSRTVTQPAAALSTSETHVNVNCFGGSNGSVDLSVSGGTTPYSYLWSTGATTQDISGRTAGTYTVTVTDANACTTTRSVSLTQPATAVSTSETHVNIICYGGNNGSIDLSVSGGSPPYAYNWGGGITTQDRTNLTAGNYTVTVTDAGGCTATRTTSITQPADIAVPITPTSPTWYGGTDGSANLTPSGGTSPYTYLWSTGATTQDISNVASGNYSVTVTDANSCTKVGSVVISNSTQAQPYCEAFTYADGTNSSSFWSRDVSGCNLGDGGYFDVRSNQFAANDLDGQGIWTSSVIDITGMSNVQASVDLAESGDLEADDYIRVYYKLNGGAETIFANNGNRTDDFTSGVSSHTGLSGNTLQIVIRVDNDATSETHTFDNVCVTGTMMFAVTATVTNDTCIGGRVGAIDITVDNAGGTPPFTYTWSTGATTQDITGLSAGNYTVTVRDVVLNTVTRTVTVSEANKFCRGALICRTIYYIIQAANGSSPPDVYYIDNYDETYTLVPINTTQTAVYNGIGYNHKDGFMYGVEHSGANSGTIWKIDSAGNSLNVGRPAGITGDQFYSATVFQDGTLATFSGTNKRLYRINIASTPPVILNYTTLSGMDFIDIAVNPRDGKVYGYDRNAERFFYTDTSFASINFFGTTYNGTSYTPGSAFFDPLGNMYIYGSNSGGGSQIYVYQVDVGINGSGTGNMTQIGTGPSVSFSDGCSCPFGYFVHKLVNPGSAMAGDTVEYMYAIGNMSLFDADLDLVDKMHDGRKYVPGSLTNPYGGTPNSYGGADSLFIENLFVASNTIDTVKVKVALPLAPIGSVVYNQAQIQGLPDGYEDTVQTDYPNSAEIPDETPLTILNRPPTVTNDTVITCFNTPIDINVIANDFDYDGNIVAASVTVTGNPANGTVTGGGGTVSLYSQPFNFSDGTTANASWTRDVSGANLGDGGHFEVRSNRWSANDIDGTEAVWSTSVVNISAYSNISLSVDLSSGGSLESSDFIRAYYKLNGGAETALTNGLHTGNVSPTTATASGLNGTTMQIVIRTRNSSTSEYYYFDNVSISGYSAGSTPGVLTYTPNAGFTGVNTFTYQVCDDGTPLPAECRTATARITVPAAVSVSLVTLVDASCVGGSIDISVSGGTAPFTYAWSNGATTQDLSGLAIGTYTVTATDVAGCSATGSYSIATSSALATSAAVTHVSCNGGSNGAIDLTVTGGRAPLSYIWSNGATTQDLTGRTAGTYTVTVTDANGCTISTNRTITQPTALSASNTFTDVSCNGGNNGAIDVTVSGGTSPYSYNWGGGITTEDRSGLTAGSYTVTVTDANGCTASTSRTIAQPTALSASNTFTNVSCNGGNNGAIDVTVSGGTSPYSYNWGGGITTEDRSGLTAGAYTVTVTDANGCTTTSNRTITQPAVLSASHTAVNVTCNGGTNGSIDLSVSGGTSPYTYNWGGGVTTQDRSAIAAGNYIVTVTDANGCTLAYPADVFQPTPLATSATTVDVVCNGASTGSIDLTVSGATPPYAYLWSNGATTQDLSSITAGAYSVTVTDAAGCTATRSATINQPAALSASNTKVDVLCNGANTGAIDVTVSGGTTPYSYNWGGGITTEDRTSLAAGTYTVTITDAAGCTITSGATITQPAALTASNVKTDVSCAGGSNGAINVTVSGGTTPYTFSWSNGATTEDLSGLSTGTYNVTVTDANNCTATTGATVTQPTVLSASTTKVDVLCNGGNTGSVNLTVGGGVTPYTFLWSNGATTEDISSLTAGVYNVTITDANSCTAAATASLAQPSAISANSVKSDLTCNGDNSGYIFLTVSGGVEPYTFLWSSGETTQDITNLVAGNYTVTITDANSCTITYSQTITEPAVISASDAVTHVTCYNGSDGAINLTVNGGLPPFLYLWSNGATTEDITGLVAGTYNITVVNMYGTCEFYYSVTVNQPASFSASTSQVNVSCNGGSNGSIDLSVSGGTSPYTYLWSNGATTQDISSLSAGTFSVTITDATSCTLTASATIAQPVAPLNPSVTQINVSCNGGNDGSIDLYVTGGTPAYTYLWSNGATTQDISSLVAGTYNVTITDNNACTATTSATITQPSALSASATKTDVSCNGGDDGSVNLTVSGGTSPYTFWWSNGETVEDLSDLSIGTYSVTITDALSCTTTASATITQPASLSASTTKVNVSCNGGSNGSIDLTVSGGTTAYTYLWSNGATTQDLTGLSAGTYSVTVTDAQSCTTTAFAAITQPNALSASTTKIDVSCNGGSNGSVDLTVSGGVTPYTYLWSTGATTQDISSRPAGTYTVTVTDANSCTFSTSATIGQPAAMSASTTKSDVSCNGGSNGSIDLTVSGGTAPYSYAWTNGAITQDISGLAIGTYEVTATDAQSCAVVTNVTITQPAAISISGTATDASCNGGSDGSYDLSVSGGVGSYTYAWSTGATTQDISGVAAGTYIVTVTDGNSCTASESVAVGEASLLTINLDSITHVSCNGGSNGAIDISASGGTIPSSYTWSNGATTQDVSGLAAGTYTVTVLDANGCNAVEGFTITQPAVLASSETHVNVSCNGGSDGSVDLTVTGGTTPYTYLWSNSATTQDISGLTTGTYSVTVTDAQSCTVTRSVNITQPATLAASAIQVNVSCNGESDASIDLSVSGGTTPYTYLWSTGATTQDINGLAIGTYNVTVTDAKSCTVTSNVTITQPAVLAASSTQVNVSCKNGSDASINLTVTGGTAPFTFVWSNGATTEDINALAIGTFSVTVTDANSCSATAGATITEPALLTASTTKVNVSCNGGSNGSVDLTVGGGTSPYTYVWSNGATTQDISGLTTGTYNVTVTDALNCTASASATVGQPAVLAASTTKVDVSCNGGSNGSIDLTVSGGTAPYTYNWTGGITTQDRGGLSIGTYNVTITDAQSCTATASATITQPAVLTVTPAITNVSCNGGNNGAVNLTISGGTMPYTYAWSNGATTQNITALVIGTYNVTVTDAQSCITTASATVTQPAVLTASTTSVNVSCNSGNNGSVDLTVNGGTTPYTYLWSNGATTQDISSLLIGTYTATITDAQSCTVTASAIITQPAALSASTTKVDVSCNGGSNGSIDLSVSGGTTAYSYLWSNGATTQDISGLLIGTYTVTVTDAQGCTISRSATISQPTLLTATTTKVDVSCNGGSNGSIDLTVNGGTTSYSYLWSNGATTQDISGLVTGTYTVTVTDAQACTVTTSATIAEPATLATSATKIDVSCNGGSNGSVDLTVSGGTTAYTYLWSNGATTQDISGLAIGTYNVTVTDAQSCTATASATIAQPSALAASAIKVDASCNSGSNGSIDLTVSGGTTTYTFLWSNGEVTEDISGLLIGTYIVTVTDAQACTISASATINQPSALTASATIADATCNSFSNGSVNLTVNGGTAPYTYNWSNGAATEDLDSLIAGTYNVTITDMQSCTVAASGNVTEPAALAASYATISASCNGGADGSIDVSVSGGTTSYNYLWTTGATTEDLSGLVAGTYGATITDAQGCVASMLASVSEASLMNISLAGQTNVNCHGGSNGAIDISVNGGTAPYNYLWSNGAITQDISGLTVGNFSVTVADANSCNSVANYTITQPLQLAASSNVANATCNASGNGAIDLTASGGVVPYSYVWSNGAMTQDINSLDAGAYNVTVTDNNGCTIAHSNTVTEPAALAISEAHTDLVCNAGATGAIDITVSGGTTAYAYLWSTGAATEDVSGLAAGNYTVTVTDANSCTAAGLATLTQPPAITITPTTEPAMCAVPNGKAFVSVSGGTPGYAYLWSTGEAVDSITNLAGGMYQITVTDANGCRQSLMIGVNAYPSANVTVAKTDVACHGGNDGSATGTVTSGTPPFTYLWIPSGGNNITATGLSAGSYTLQVFDSVGCTVLETVDIMEPSDFSISLAVDEPSCNGGSDGSINLTVSGSTPGYAFSWSNGAASEDIGSLPAGSYSVTIADVRSCTISASASISQPGIITASTTKSDVSCNGGNNGSINLTVGGGTAPYAYSWSNGMTTKDIAFLTAAGYTVTITDNQGCSATTTASVAQPDTLSLTFIQQNVRCNGNANGSINISVSGGTAPYSFLWSNGATSEDAGGLVAGNYTVTVTDANSCFTTQNITIIQPMVLAASLVKVDVSCNGGNNGSIDLAASGGTSPHSYTWSNGATTEDISGLTIGNYIVTVSDANSCSVSQGIVVAQPAALLAAAVRTNVSCNGGADGSVDLIVSGGTPGYAYLWSNGATTQDITGLAIGSYTVTVTDANVCTATANAAVAQPSPMTASSTSIDVSCNGGTNGSIDLTVNGGTTPYAYLWSNGATTQDISGLTAGTYAVTITDAKNCTLTTSATVMEPLLLTASVTKADAACNGASSGSIDLTVSGGTSPYGYNWSTGASTQDVSGLIIGTYNVTVTDSKGCIANAGATIVQPAALSASLAKADAGCNGGNDGSIDLTVSGGAPAYAYLWSNGATTEDVSGLIAGAYSVTVTDANGCSIADGANVDQPSPVAITYAITGVACNSGNNGAIDITVSGGTPGYSYSWSNGATVQDITGLASGSYNVTVSDNNNCSAVLNISVNQAAVINATVTQQDVACSSDSSGFIHLAVSGGVAPYNFIWSNGAVVEDLNNIPAGSYTVTVTDANSCSVAHNTTVNEPAAIAVTVNIANALCNGSATGSITLAVSGGMPAYSYLWSTGATTKDISALTAGNFIVTVTDANACFETKSFSVSEPAQLSMDITGISDATCNGVANGTITISVSGGAAPYSYLWSNGATTSSTTGLAAGSYGVTVTDANNCMSASNYNIGQPSLLTISETSVSPALCNGSADGSINITASGGIPAYSFSWNTGATTEDISGLITGSYSVTVTDSQNCPAVNTFNIGEPASFAVAVSASQDASCYGDASGSINVSVSGGTPPYTYSWSHGATTQNVSGLAAGSYSVTVTDVNNCAGTASRTINQPALLTLKTSGISDAKCFEQASGSVNITVNGGTTPYNFLWSNGATTEDLANAIAGSYTVTVTDSKSCSKSSSYNIGQPAAAMMISITGISDAKCHGEASGFVNISVSGGTLPYSYSWSNGAATQNATALGVGTYSVTVTDAQACARVGTYNIGQPGQLVASTTNIVNAKCSGQADGSIDISVNGGTPAYSYTWSNGATTQDISNTSAGSYTVTVTDANSCALTHTAGIGQPTDIGISLIDSINATCSNGSNGAIDISVTGGTSPYSYSWSNGTATQDIASVKAGSYTLTITDANNCIKHGSFNISQPAAIAIAVSGISDAACKDQASGSISISVSGGTQPYLTRWSNGADESTVTGIAAGSYSVTIADANGCIETQNYNIGEPDAIAINAGSIADVRCHGDSTGAIDIVTAGGTTPYAYSWSNGAVTQNLTGVMAGIYEVTVIDDNGCEGVEIFSVNEPNELSAEITGITHARCNAGNDGSVDVTVSGGVPPYSYKWSNGMSAVHLSGLIAGIYSVTVTDSNYCKDYASAEVQQATSLNVQADIDSVKCFGGSDGSINITPSGGTAPYSFSWSTGATTEDVSGLAAGNYIVSISDVNICNVVMTYPVAQAEIIADGNSNVIQPSCKEANDGSIELNITGGNPPFTYRWSNEATTAYINEISEGTYNVTVTDVNGCTGTAAFILNASACNLPPVAVNDTSGVTTGRGSDIPVMNNDYDPDDDNINITGIIHEPAHGTTTINNDGTITYTPFEDYTGEDAFTYVICDDGNPKLCDTAIVFITVLPDKPELFIPTAISPNQDESNEYWEIKGIGEFPDNEVLIFNRWGNEVYRVKGYKNQWNGVNQNKEPLPDGSYYYILKLNDINNSIYTGYVVIFRG